MPLYKSAGVPDKMVGEAGDSPHIARRLRGVRRTAAIAIGRHADLASSNGRVHASSRRRSERDRCLVIVQPSSFDQACRALGPDEGAVEIMRSVGQEPLPLSTLLGGGLRDVVEAHGARRVLIAPSGRAVDEQVLELTVDAALETATVSVPSLGLTRSARLTKRCLDLVIAAVAIVLFAPLLCLIATLVKLGSPGPMLFSQTRVGRGGRTFQMLKFRTMVQDAEARKRGLVELNERRGLFKIREDPRVTSIGRWLRQTNLDELPQLVNVLRGEMSLVGPRPLVPDEDAGIRGWRRRRLDVSPGMTGCWQVLGAARVSLEEMVVIDYLYIANRSLWRDVKCMLSTAPSVILRRGT
jgi:lipopolysaccharide/colanic/teichoic acid biosynthesis glycosyltransferase